MKKTLILGFTLLNIIAYTQKYVGVGFQKELNESWTIEVDFKTKEIVVNYPALSCSGTWTLIKHIDNGSLYKETITEGTEQCLAESIYLLAKDPISATTTRFYVYETSEKSLPYATGLMEKTNFIK